MHAGKVAVKYRNESWLELDIYFNLAPFSERQALAISVMVLAIGGQQNLAVITDEASHRPRLWLVEGVQRLENHIMHLC